MDDVASTKIKGSRKPQLSSLQDPFLDGLRRDRIPTSIYLVNGIKLVGEIDTFDQFSVMLKNATTQVIYKRAISTIVPGRDFKIRSEV